MTAPHWLADLIRREGSLPLSRYMSLCLTDPDHGYYSHHQALGAEGDFITAPELSPLFGEIIGLWLLQNWLDIGAPKPFALVEAGPGLGTLSTDILRCFALRKEARASLTLHLVETSSHLRRKQAERLERLTPDINPVWHSDIESLPSQPTLFIANEFFDALPSEQFIKTGDGWGLVAIDLDKDNKLKSVLIPSDKPYHPCADDAETGDCLEVSHAVKEAAQKAGALIQSQGGAGLIIDYGTLSPAKGDSFQAIFDQKSADPLSHPGKSDLTFHVDFSLIKRSLPSSLTLSTMTQRQFLQQNGLALRMQALQASLPISRYNSLVKGVNRLIHPDAMGSLFKVLAFSSKP